MCGGKAGGGEVGKKAAYGGQLITSTIQPKSHNLL